MYSEVIDIRKPQQQVAHQDWHKFTLLNFLGFCGR